MSTIALAPAGSSPAGLAPRVAVPRAVAPRAVAPRLRLTRRGRAVFATLLAAPIAIALAVAGFSGAPAQAGVTPATGTFDYITVATGESLWDLAGWIAPDADPRDVVEALTSLNQLTSAEVQPGQRLAIPAAYAG